MRQAGVLAAAGLIALQKHPPKLVEDHCKARFLAEALNGVPGIHVDVAKVQTNIVMFDVSGTGLTAAEFSSRLRARGLLINPVNDHRLRLVTHSDADQDSCAEAARIIAEAAGSGDRVAEKA
jgi:threonine aldolase